MPYLVFRAASRDRVQKQDRDRLIYDDGGRREGERKGGGIEEGGAASNDVF